MKMMVIEDNNDCNFDGDDDNGDDDNDDDDNDEEW